MPPKHSFWQRKSIRFGGWTNSNHKKIFWLSALTFIIDLYVPWIMRKCGKRTKLTKQNLLQVQKYINMYFIQIHKWPYAFLSDTHNLTFASNSYFQQHFNDQRLESQILLAWKFFRLGKACNLERDLWLQPTIQLIFWNDIILHRIGGRAKLSCAKSLKFQRWDRTSESNFYSSYQLDPFDFIANGRKEEPNRLVVMV